LSALQSGRAPRSQLETLAVDKLVGRRIRLRRVMLGLSQQRLGKAIDVSFQQIQKYELGRNRVGASRLHMLAKTLDVPVAFFFDDTDPTRALPMLSAAASTTDLLDGSETRELVNAYFAISDADIRRSLLVLVKTLSGKDAVAPDAG